MTELDLSLNINHLPRLEARRSLADTVHHTLREAITQGALAPGARLPEVGLARQLGVSPTPVREALRRLEREGLVDASPHRGASVVSFAPSSLANLYEIHEILESHAVRRAAESTGGDGDTPATGVNAFLDDATARLTEMDAILGDTDQRAFNQLDLAFHRSLNSLSGNPMLVDLIEQTHRRIQAARIRYEVHLPDRPAQSQRHHCELLEAVRAGDADRAESLAGMHIRAVRGRVLEMLSQANQTLSSGDEAEPRAPMHPASRPSEGVGSETR